MLNINFKKMYQVYAFSHGKVLVVKFVWASTQVLVEQGSLQLR